MAEPLSRSRDVVSTRLQRIAFGDAVFAITHPSRGSAVLPEQVLPK